MGGLQNINAFRQNWMQAWWDGCVQHQTSPLSLQHEADACKEPHRTCSGQYDVQESRNLYQFALIPASVGDRWKFIIRELY